jgi:hypothetical protein
MFLFQSADRIFTVITRYARSIIWMFFFQENRIFSLLPVSKYGLCSFYFFFSFAGESPTFRLFLLLFLHAITIHRQRNLRQGYRNKHLSQVFTATPPPAVGKFFITGHNHGHHLKHVTYKLLHQPSKKVHGDETYHPFHSSYSSSNRQAY